MAKCALSGRKTSFGNTRSHARNKQRRTWKANVHRHRIFNADTGSVQMLYLSAKALRTLSKHGMHFDTDHKTTAE
jgi:large subunit ribosomal protein L28